MSRRPHNFRGWYVGDTGYTFTLQPDHPKSNTKGYVLEHILIAERALGKFLPEHAKIHHCNEQRSDNHNQNLVICQDQAYHMILHQRMRARAACGNPNWLKCPICKVHDDPQKIYVAPSGLIGGHKLCRKTYIDGWRSK